MLHVSAVPQSTHGATSSQGPMPLGRLRAKVVAADSIRADTQKEVVVYKIRAADANGEWTVSRRYSNFEQLHRQLRDVSPVICSALSVLSLSSCWDTVRYIPVQEVHILLDDSCTCCA